MAILLGLGCGIGALFLIVFILGTLRLARQHDERVAASLREMKRRG